MTQPIALLLSIAVEAAVAFVFVSALRWGSGGRAAAAAAVGTLCTHWLAWHGALRLMRIFDYATTVLIVETGVVIAESVAYLVLVPLSLRRSLAASLVANGASTGFGLLLYALKLA